MGASDADTAAGEDDGLAWGGIDTGDSAGVRNWRSIGFVIDISVSIGRDAGVGADDGCDDGVRIWRGAGRGSGAECRGRD
jgi:hypothetical protein